MPRGNDISKYDNRKTLTTQLRHYGYIQAVSTADDGRGGEVETWVNTHPNPHNFAVLPMSTKQVMDFASINVEATHMIKFRGLIDISELNRIVIESRIFEVLTVENYQERDILKVAICKERRS